MRFEVTRHWRVDWGTKFGLGCVCVVCVVYIEGIYS
jgi:hypothetical protein